MDILVIDPERAALISAQLGEHGSTTVIETEGRTGTGLALLRGFSTIVLSTTTGTLDGFRWCRLLRDAEIWTPVLMIGTPDDRDGYLRALEAGADDFLDHPVDTERLVARVRSLIRLEPGLRPPPLRVGDLVLDPADGVVHRGTVPVHLSGREYAVLRFLMLRRGLTTTKADIYATVWGRDDGGTNLVEVCVSGLRRKLDDPFERSSIKTVHGQGYRMVDDSSAGLPAPAVPHR